MENWTTEKWATEKWGNRHPAKPATENWATNLLLTGSLLKKSLAFMAVVVTHCVFVYQKDC